jgi:hypothetical protein
MASLMRRTLEADQCADLQQLEADRATGRLGELGVCEADPAQGAEQHIGHEARAVRCDRWRAGAIRVARAKPVQPVQLWRAQQSPLGCQVATPDGGTISGTQRCLPEGWRMWPRRPEGSPHQQNGRFGARVAVSARLWQRWHRARVNADPEETHGCTIARVSSPPSIGTPGEGRGGPKRTGAPVIRSPAQDPADR